MKTILLLIIPLLSLSIVSCSSGVKKDSQIDFAEVEKYLQVNPDQKIADANTNLLFWKDKLDASPNQFPYHIKIAGIETTLFELTGQITHLKAAENHFVMANEASGGKFAGYQRSLAHNYISQHRFKEALVLLEQAELNGERLLATQKMLFDVHLELGNDDLAGAYLEMIKNENDFDYLIRKAKWEDHEGHLDHAITFMQLGLEKATYIGEPSLMQWAHTNIADFYGHAGKIDLAFQHYIAALTIDPTDVYAKKGIAWIAYAQQRDIPLAKHILGSITGYYHAPDYDLFQAELAAYENNLTVEQKHIDAYFDKVKDERYGVMYNTYNIELLCDGFGEKLGALQLARDEVKERPTAMSYSYLAYASLHNGFPEQALEIVEKNVRGHSTEPVAMYHMAEVYRANSQDAEVADLKSELLQSAYELGPVMIRRIEKL